MDALLASTLVGLALGLTGCEEPIPAETPVAEAPSVAEFLAIRDNPGVRAAMYTPAPSLGVDAPVDDTAPIDAGGDEPGAPDTNAHADADTGAEPPAPPASRAALASAEGAGDALNAALRSIAAHGASDDTLETLILGDSQCGSAGRALVRWQKADAARLGAEARPEDARRRAIGLIDTATAFARAAWAAARLDPVRPDGRPRLIEDPHEHALVMATNAQAAFRSAVATLRALDEADPAFLTPDAVDAFDESLAALHGAVLDLGPVVEHAGAFSRRSLERFAPSVEDLRAEVGSRAHRGADGSDG